jgi:hypothetical protein
MTRKVTAPCLRTRLLLLPTLSNQLPPSDPHTHPRYWQQTPERWPPGTMPAPSVHLYPPARATCRSRSPKKHALCASSQRTLLCCVQYILTIEKGKNVLAIRVLFCSRALTRIVYLYPCAWHSRADTKTGCSIACPDGICQEVRPACVQSHLHPTFAQTEETWCSLSLRAASISSPSAGFQACSLSIQRSRKSVSNRCWSARVSNCRSKSDSGLSG